MWEMYGMNVWTSGCTVLYAFMNVGNVRYECVNKWLYCTVCMYDCVDCTVFRIYIYIYILTDLKERKQKM